MSHAAPTVTVRTHLRIPLRFADGYGTTARVFTFDGLADGREHLALGLGDRGRRVRPEGAPGPAAARPAAQMLHALDLALEGPAS